MGAAQAVANSNSDRRSISFYLGQSPLSVAINEGNVEHFATCFELVELLPNTDLQASPKLPGRCGDFFVIGEGQVDVSVKVPSGSKKTGYIREVLCSKKQGDILYVPAVESLAGSVQSAAENPNRENEENIVLANSSRFRRTSARLYRLLGRLDKRSVSNLEESTIEGSSREPVKRIAATEAETVIVGTTSPKSRIRQQKAEQSLNRIEKLMKHLDMTTVTAPYGATLLRLDKNRFDAFEAAILKLNKSDFREGSFTKNLPLSRHALETGELPNTSEKDKEEALRKKTRTDALPDFELMRVMMASNIQDYLKRIPFLTKVPMSRIQMLGEMSQFEVLPKEHIVCNEGAQGDRVFVVIFGQLAVYTKRDEVNHNTPPVVKLGASDIAKLMHANGKLIGTMSQGDHFGEMSVLADIPRQATVKTKTSCLLISISRAHFRNLMKVVPDVGESVQNVMRLYMLTKFFHSLLYSDVLKKLDQKFLENRLLPTCQLIEAPADFKIIVEGQDAEAFFFVYHGRVVATQNAAVRKTTLREIDEAQSDEEDTEDPDTHLGVLGPGCYFGEISILTETPCRASIVTVSRCMLLKVSKIHFRDVWCTIPEFRAEFIIRIYGKSCRLDHVLLHNLARAAFAGFLHSEHASENLLFLDAVQDYSSKYGHQSADLNMETANKIIVDYLDPDSTTQVNVPQHLLKRVRSELESMEAKIDPQKRIAPKDLFSACRDEIFTILEMGTFARFKKTSEFQDILTKLRAYEQVDLSNVERVSNEDRARSQRRLSFAPPPTEDQRRELIGI